jgi:hypothetical protein
VCYLVAFVLFVAAIAGFVHAATKSAEHRVLTATTDQPSQQGEQRQSPMPVS